MKIIVLAGGLSTERDVSLASGGGITRTLLDLGHDAYLLDLFLGLPQLTCGSSEEKRLSPADIFTQAGHGLEISDAVPGSEPDLEAIKALRDPNHRGLFGPNVIALCQAADLVFIALHGGDGENGKVQAYFDLMNIAYTGTGALGCAISMDKGLSKDIFNANDIPTPQGITLQKGEIYPHLPECGIQFPVVVKPAQGGSSIGVYIATDAKEFQNALAKSFQYEDEVVIEEFIKGREFACGILLGKALPPIEIIPNVGFFDYANKYQAGASKEICPAELDEKTTLRMQELTLAAFSALKLGVYARADFLLDENSGNLYILEMNTLPGMTATSLMPQEAAAAGIDYPSLVQTILDASLALRKSEWGEA